MIDPAVVNSGIGGQARNDLERKGIGRLADPIPVGSLDVASLSLLFPGDDRSFRATNLQHETSHATGRRPDRTRDSQDRGRTVLVGGMLARNANALGRLGIDSPRTEIPCAADRRIRNETRRDPELFLPPDHRRDDQPWTIQSRDLQLLSGTQFPPIRGQPYSATWNDRDRVVANGGPWSQRAPKSFEKMQPALGRARGPRGFVEGTGAGARSLEKRRGGCRSRGPG